tara:strand:- start:824 stop:1027 length:204 start_codon:yes stop_codon:yes gene_type:complete
MKQGIKEKLIHRLTESIIQLEQGIEAMQELRLTVFTHHRRRKDVDGWIVSDREDIFDYKEELKRLAK